MSERSEQIYEAFVRCLAREGFEGTTLEAVAAEAGLPRPAIRHFVGNRDALIEGAARHLTRRYERHFAATLEALPARPAPLLDFLFLGGFARDLPDEGAAVSALAGAASRSPSARRALRRMYGVLEDALVGHLARAFPRAATGSVRGTAFALMCLAEQSAELIDLGFPRARAQDARTAGAHVLSALATPRRNAGRRR